MTSTDRLAELEATIDLVRPFIERDGGTLTLIAADVESGRIEIQLSGSCSSCAISTTTLHDGLERILRERLAWVSEVVGSVDQAFDEDLSVSLGQGAYVPRWTTQRD